MTQTAVRHKPPLVWRVLAALLVVVVMVGGIIGLGRIADSDLMAMVITSMFFAVVFAVIGSIAWRDRRWLVALGLPFVLVAGVAGYLLAKPIFTSVEVSETVAVAGASGAELIASGTFKPLSHPGMGTASLVRVSEESAVVTLTDFTTDNGPDVRVYLSYGTSDNGEAESFVDLGALKGNKGNQQYAIPAGTDLTDVDAIVLWCRAFDVGFTQARLTTTG